MTGAQVTAQLRLAVRTAVRAGARCRRRPGVGGVMEGAADFAELLVMPAVEAMVEQAVEAALDNACRPWPPGEPRKAPPNLASPLWDVWAAGAVCAIDALAAALGVQLSDPQLEGQDAEALVRAEIDLLLAEARQAAR
jgi:hypothetical protein